ncbi:hypothetical protein ACFWEH_36195 [Streptomyces anulatus]|uniref:hypothetical protein n=1 Tax=Streptomyces TaxID=1883 RepID=UPI000939F20B|nr:hypothetical protein [Streptomyces sp. TSRI0395]OKI74024.1 hypothetical protein AMK12_37230 [Streptomyces sp. TSRI0395]
MDPTGTDSTDDLQAPCECGTLGDHPTTLDCIALPVVDIEVSGARTVCLQVIGLLRSNYRVDIKHRWKDPETGEWVFKAQADLVYVKPYIAPPTPTPEAAVMACLEDQIGLEVTQHLIYVITGLDDQTLTATLTALAAAGEIERVGPGLYRKNP